MRIKKIFILFALLIGLAESSLSYNPNARAESETNHLPDISGLAWIEQDRFLAVHDAKNPEENNRPRVSLLSLPQTAEGIRWKSLELDWPLPLKESSDLESIARIPGTQLFLLVESGESSYKGQRFGRIFLVELKAEKLVIRSFTQLPATTRNIEGSAVFRSGDRLAFVCAERADHQVGSKLFWADLKLEPFELGKFQQTFFRPGRFTGRNKRPVSAIEIDKQGQIYIASAYDSDDDNGPFTSMIWRAGRILADRSGKFRVDLLSRPVELARLDGLKVESLAIREREQKAQELFAGTDDENYGGAIRLIPNQP
ncbi:MAG: hypothetical protein WBV94_31170 [Blastocatellia bacterium]